VTGSLGFATKVGLDHLLTSGILGGDIQELLHHARGLAAMRVDECFIGRAADEGIDDDGVSDAGELVALLGETLDVLSEGLIGPLRIVAKIP
jgi:hypothetical protein